MLANSPPECPSPVKSKRRAAIPSPPAGPRVRRAAGMSLPQVKQCASTCGGKVWPLRQVEPRGEVMAGCPGKVKRRWAWANILSAQDVPRCRLISRKRLADLTPYVHTRGERVMIFCPGAPPVRGLIAPLDRSSLRRTAAYPISAASNG